jgi:hypothetical protein
LEEKSIFDADVQSVAGENNLAVTLLKSACATGLNPSFRRGQTSDFEDAQ